MPVIPVIGGQWGDEGKGKIIDLLAERAHMVVRFSGGANAGHTVVNPKGEFRLHLVPSGIFYPQVKCVIGSGVVVDPAVLLEEIEGLEKQGVETGNLYISDRAHVVLPYHILLDSLEEQARGESALGTTRRGIGPAFSDKVSRRSIRMVDLTNPEELRLRLSSSLEHKNALLTRLYGVSPLPLEELFQKCREYGERLSPFICQTELIIHEAIARREVVLLEGAQGTLLDLDYGTYPYVTSSSPSPTAAGASLGLGPTRVNRVLGVMKAYTTRVGAGPLPTELKDETGELLRQRGREYGATTGRARRCGWFDAVVGRYSVLVNGFSSIALTRLDILDSFASIKVCASYELDGRRISHPPSSAAALERCRPVYEEHPGWQQPTSEARGFRELPRAARAYVRRLEEVLGCPASLVSVGAHRQQTIWRRPFP